MKIAGIVAEYNPFHEGHAYHLKEAREQSGADFCVAVMSGYFVQRGEPAVYEPFGRARAALERGADAVFLLPARVSTAAAGDFAEGSVRILDGLGCDCICYGVEAGAGDDRRSPGFAPDADPADFLSPNNILAEEYRRAVQHLGSAMECIGIPRAGHAYHDTELTGEYPSAAALRKKILAERTPADAAVSPDDVLPYLEATVRRLLREGVSPEDFMDVNRELADRIAKCDFTAKTYEELVLGLKTKRYAYTRVARCLMHILLDLRKDAEEKTYAHLIGFRRDSGDFLAEIKKRSSIPLISKPADAGEMLSEDAYASEMYGMISQKKVPCNFYRQQRIIVL